MLEQLRQRLHTLQKTAGIEGDHGALPLGIGVIDQALGGGLARGALHEIAAASEAHLAAATGFALGLAALPSARQNPMSFRGASKASEPGIQSHALCLTSLDSGSGATRRPGMTKHILWLAEDMALAESGAPYGPGLDAFGLAPERLLTVAAAHTRDLLWAMEEALRCRAVDAAIGELRDGEIDPVALRRLSLAAGESGALALLLRARPASGVSTAATRWIVGAVPQDRFSVELVRNRRGPLGTWILEWSDSDERLILAPAQPVAAPALDRPHQKVA